MSAGPRSRLVPLSEREWQRHVTDLAEILGWSWAHWRPAMTTHGWRTPVSGPLGAGFPDLLLVHPRRRATLLVELKADRGRLSPEQRAVHEVLRTAGLEVRTWRPRDWDDVAATLATPTATTRPAPPVTESARPTGLSRAISTGGDRPAGGPPPHEPGRACTGAGVLSRRPDALGTGDPSRLKGDPECP